MDLIGYMTEKVFNKYFHQEILLPKVRNYPKEVQDVWDVHIDSHIWTYGDVLGWDGVRFSL